MLSIFILMMAVSPTLSAMQCRWALMERGGSSAEIEMATSDPVVNLLTTQNGRASGISNRFSLLKFLDLPREFVQWARNTFPRRDPRNIEWNEIPIEIRRALITRASENKKTSFFEDRRVPNVRLQDYIEVTFTRPTMFMGRKYEAGTHQISTSNFGRVEFRSPEDMKAFTGIELHLRSRRESAGTILRSVWNLQAALRIPKTHMHVHTVVPIPTAALQRHRLQTSLAITEYYRRANMAAELIGALRGYDLGHIANPTSPTITDFDVMRPNFLNRIFSFFMNGATEHLGSSLKAGWIGFRGSDVYDQPNVYGFESRFLFQDLNENRLVEFLDHLEEGMRTENYGFNQEDMVTWYNSKLANGQTPENIFSSIWFHYDNRNIPLEANNMDSGQRVPAELVPYLTRLTSPEFRERWRALNTDNEAYRLLFYDWAADPIFLNDQIGQTTVREAQKQSVEMLLRLINRPNQTANSLSNFIRTSGILPKLHQTFNMSFD